MSDDLRPWLEEGAPEGLDELLRSAVVDEPTSAQLVALQAKLGPLFWSPPPDGGGGGGGSDGGLGSSGAGAGGASAASGGAVAAGVGVGTKIALVATVSTLVAGVVTFQAGRAYERANAPPPPPAAVVPVAPVAVAPPPPVLEEKPAPAPQVKPAVKAAPPKVEEAAAPAEPPKQVDELDALQEAMESVRAGKPGDALAKLERHAKDFPDSPLAQERDVLIIEALVSLGRNADARVRADEFRKKWPTSTHLVRIETLLRKP